MINSFKGDHEFLSNFFFCWVKLDDIFYSSVEHAYQASKTLVPEERAKIRQALTPGKAKRLGRKVTLRPDFQEVKLPNMADFIRQKFTPPLLVAAMVSTQEHELVEGNVWHDNYWGDCSCKKCAGKPGVNMLGKLLMDRREKLLLEIQQQPIYNGNIT